MDSRRRRPGMLVMHADGALMHAGTRAMRRARRWCTVAWERCAAAGRRSPGVGAPGRRAHAAVRVRDAEDATRRAGASSRHGSDAARQGVGFAGLPMEARVHGRGGPRGINGGSRHGDGAARRRDGWARRWNGAGRQGDDRGARRPRRVCAGGAMPGGKAMEGSDTRAVRDGMARVCRAWPPMRRDQPAMHDDEPCAPRGMEGGGAGMDAMR